jgi:phosphate acetyltransferase
VTFITDLRMRAAAAGRRVAFPESADQRVLQAVRDCVVNGVVRPVLVLDPTQPAAHEPARATGAECVIAEVEEPLLHAVSMAAIGQVDACVAGSVYTTAEVVRAALRLVGPAPGISTVSSAFYMVARTEWGTGARVLTFTDCAVVPYPTAEQLAEIAISAGRDRVLIVGDEARVAFLSFSTHGSSTGDSVKLVTEAVRIVREREPDLLVDGELQADAALVPGVSRRKAPGGVHEGNANVLVFPSLDSGNIAYKLVERLAGAYAIGPILQGLRRPVADLSRGAEVEDIINVAAVAALKAE